MRSSRFKKKVFEEAALVSHLTYQIGELNSLREVSKDVEVSEIRSQPIQGVILKLKKVLRQYRKLTGKGRGVAAIQIGIPLRIAVVFQDKQSLRLCLKQSLPISSAKGEKIIAIVNPKVTRKSKTLFKYPEICMSANPIIAKVTRPAFIEFEYYDEHGNSQIWDNHENRLMNRVFQHEIDHMEGIVNIDLVESKELILNSDPKFFKDAKFEEISKQ